MSITDELRMYVQDWRDTPSLMDNLDRGDVDGILADFIRIADRMDERFQAEMANAWERGYRTAEEEMDGPGALSELEERVSRLERMLNHRGKR